MGEVLPVARIAARVRLDGHRSTQAFRLLLDALAHPGRVLTVPAELTDDDVPAAALLPLALADLGTSVHVAGAPWLSGPLTEVVHTATGARTAPVGAASLVVSLDADPTIPERLFPGTADAPEAATRLSVQVDDIEAGEALVIDGPGVAEPTYLRMGLDRDFLAALQRCNRPPVGIDTWVFDRHHRMVALPRSTRLTVNARTVLGGGVR